MKFLVCSRLSEHRYKTPEGYLVCVDSILSRTGKQTYSRDELFKDGRTDEVEVERSAEEVFSEKTLASFENKPLTIEHPEEDVTPANHNKYSVGFIRDVKRGKDGSEDVMLGTIVVTDAEAIELIETGKLKELSCGYDCDIEDEDNPQQRNIRGNHVALCEKGRAGIARIVDSKCKDEQLYAVEFTYNGDSRSDYLGHVNVRAKSEQDALTKAKRWAVEHYDNPGFFKIASTKYTNVETIDSINDAKTEYIFNYHDTYHGTRDKMRVDANNLDEAIREFGKTMALGGFGTANIYVVSVSPNDGYMRAYGKLSEMLKQKWTRDSVKDSTYKVEYISSGAEIYPIVEVDAASEFEAVETVRKKDKKYIRLISVKKKDSAKTLDSKKLLSIVRAVKSVKK